MAHAVMTKTCSLGRLMTRAAEAYHAGDLDQARRRYRQVLAREPRHQAALSELGAVSFVAGDLAEAEALMQRAVAVAPDAPTARFNLAVLLARTHRPAEAASHLEACVAVQPDHAAAHALLGDLHHDAGDDDRAVAAHLRAVMASPAQGAYLAALARDLRRARFNAYRPEIEPLLRRIVERRVEAPQVYAGAVFSFLATHPTVRRVAALVADGGLAPVELYAACIAPLADLSLLHAVLAAEIVRDVELERLLGAVRRAVLAATLVDGRRDGDAPIVVALGLQGFLNEFVIAESAAEAADVDELVARLHGASDLDAVGRRNLLSTLAMYRPLGDVAGHLPIAEIAADVVLAPLVRVHLLEPMAERAIAQDLPSIGAVADATSAAVREQYETNPYPRWATLRVPGPAVAFRERIAAAVGHEVARDFDLARPSVLIAGTGTGKHALQTAERFQTARITALDISRASLAYAIRKTREAQVGNVRYVHGDILDCARLDERFGLVESVGVLHHMADPLAGWRALTGVLQPRGLMKIGLYSGHARRRLEEIRSWIRANALGADVAGIRACRAHVQREAVAGDPALANLCRTQDFCSTSGCRDLLFHVQEQVVDIATIDRWLAALDLEFLGFEFADTADLARARRAADDAATLRRLDFWHDYEMAHRSVFAGMYVFWCRARA